MSTKATERLNDISICGKKLVRDCPTRWSSTFLVIERLLQVRSSLATVLRELELDDLATSDWKHLENIYTLLKPFAQYTSLVSGEEFTTLSSIIPVVTELSLHLEEVCCSFLFNMADLVNTPLQMKKNPDVSEAVSVLLVNLKQGNTSRCVTSKKSYVCYRWYNLTSEGCLLVARDLLFHDCTIIIINAH